ncbi:MAG: DinB family protein [Pseudomonadota bacterium]
MGDLAAQPTSSAASLQMLARYRAWAVDLTLQHLALLPVEELLKPRPTTFGSILQTLAHIDIVDQIFKGHLEGREHGYTSRHGDQILALDELQSAMRETSRWIIYTCDRLSESDLARRVKYKSVDGDPNEMTTEQILLHLINHATYHIGYVSDMMYQIPAEPPTTDLTVFVRDVWRVD